MLISLEQQSDISSVGRLVGLSVEIIWIYENIQSLSSYSRMHMQWITFYLFEISSDHNLILITKPNKYHFKSSTLTLFFLYRIKKEYMYCKIAK